MANLSAASLLNEMRRPFGRPLVTLIAVLAVSTFAQSSTAQSPTARFSISGDRGTPLPCRIHLQGPDGKPVQVDGLPFWHDHFVCSGRAEVPLKPGEYHWEIERGPEYERASGEFEITRTQRGVQVDVELSRIASLRKEGWYGGDTHIHRGAHEIVQLMRSEDLDFAPVVEWWNGAGNDSGPANPFKLVIDSNRAAELRVGEDERQGGALLYFGLGRPLDITSKSREYPSPMRFVDQARAMRDDVWIDIEKPFWWDVPTWIASGKMNSIGLANNHMCRSSMLESEAWGRPRDVARLPNPLGNGYWTQEIYYHLLESGIRVPPSAGSASGVLPNPVGYNRVYVHLGKSSLTRDAWFEALSKGRAFVTNGPLLRVTADGQLPGSVLKLPGNSSSKLPLSIELTSNDPVSSIEIIHNGRLLKALRCDQKVHQTLSTTLVVDEPGWFLVRAIADVDSTFRFASTAPWYVEGPNGEQRVSKASAEFFQTWLEERIEAVRANVTEPQQLREVLEPHIEARAFWRQRVRDATSPGGRVEETSIRLSPEP